MSEVTNIRWPEIDERWHPRTQALACLAAGIAAWAIVICALMVVWF